jgi:hypothetical protein
MVVSIENTFSWKSVLDEHWDNKYYIKKTMDMAYVINIWF